ncbi:MAG: TIGR02757 family protein, partial [Sphingobacteriales bacterium]|nr:TIGR02757 family protein [Sphingobacteriales bacterium]
WGNRKAIVSNGHKLMDLLGNAPYDFVMNHKASDLKKLENFVHRTFNATDLIFFIKSLKNMYKKHGGIEQVFIKNANEDSLQPAIHEFKNIFFEIPHLERTSKHVSDPFKGSAAKKINMYLRWMIRKDTTGVDFGIWNSISPSVLSCPLDVHSGNVARKLGLLDRTQNDHKAVVELDASLREIDKNDPVKYDFALFGLGVFEGF